MPLALLGGPPTRTRPFAPWPSVNTATRKALIAAHDSGMWWQNGDSTAEELEVWLEAEFGRRVIAVSSGTAALELALASLGIGHGDEVLVPACTFVSSAAAVSARGALPIPVDIDPATFTLDTGIAEAAITSRTRAIIPVHLAGHPADLTAITALARRHHLAVIEDAAQAVAASWDGTRVGTATDATVLSFQAAKLLPGGDGGALLLRDEQTARRAERLANCGRPRGSSAYDHELLGTNARISVFTAALVLAHTRTYEHMWRARDGQWHALAQALVDRGHGGLLTQPHPKATRHDHYAVLLRLPVSLTERGVRASTVAAALTAEGIPARTLFPPWQSTPAYRDEPQVSVVPTSRAFEAAATTVTLPHQLLLDPYFPAQTASALSKIIVAVDDLIAWQQI
ncbi:DegT/DnrJ/EryC1/StrS family aminotransferase [Streptomyces sp. NPDC088124]|uniref:DegT/DnrJ/EryC1/StrS aminotransferase family protein n=1 Tax=Streptomyces sp. NPDC088124 TaxID=3154654 RepID=UPI0034271C40